MIGPLVLAALLATEAGEAPAITQQTPPAVARWYGAPAVITEAAAVGLSLAGAYIQNETSLAATGRGTDLALLALTAWLVGPAINHGAHGHPRKAFGSLGLRMGAVVAPIAVGLLLNAAINPDHNLVCTGDPPPTDCSGVPLIVLGLGVIGGVATVTIVDDAVLARDTVPRRAEGVSLVPRLRVARGGAVLSLGASF
jgi:hypothetical protein